MTEQAVKELFSKVVTDNTKMKRVGASKHQRYNWRNPDRQETKLGTMLEVLFKLDLIEIKNEPTGPSK